MISTITSPQSTSEKLIVPNHLNLDEAQREMQKKALSTMEPNSPKEQMYNIVILSLNRKNNSNDDETKILEKKVEGLKIENLEKLTNELSETAKTFKEMYWNFRKMNNRIPELPGSCEKILSAASILQDIPYEQYTSKEDIAETKEKFAKLGRTGETDYHVKALMTFKEFASTLEAQTPEEMEIKAKLEKALSTLTPLYQGIYEHDKGEVSM